jgi:hypothetical protein
MKKVVVLVLALGFFMSCSNDFMGDLYSPLTETLETVATESIEQDIKDFKENGADLNI